MEGDCERVRVVYTGLLDNGTGHDLPVTFLCNSGNAASLMRGHLICSSSPILVMGISDKNVIHSLL